MSLQAMSLNIQIPSDELGRFDEMLSSIKNSLGDLVQPLKDIRDSLIAAIEPISTPIEPEIDISGLEAASNICAELSAAAGIVSSIMGTLLVFPEIGASKVGAAVAGIFAANLGFLSWLLSLDWSSVGESFSGFWDSICTEVRIFSVRGTFLCFKKIYVNFAK